LTNFYPTTPHTLSQAKPKDSKCSSPPFPPSSSYSPHSWPSPTPSYHLLSNARPALAPPPPAPPASAAPSTTTAELAPTTARPAPVSVVWADPALQDNAVPSSATVVLVRDIALRLAAPRAAPPPILRPRPLARAQLRLQPPREAVKISGISAAEWTGTGPSVAWHRFPVLSSQCGTHNVSEGAPQAVFFISGRLDLAKGGRPPSVPLS
jgi:hypothetical protein